MLQFVKSVPQDTNSANKHFYVTWATRTSNNGRICVILAQNSPRSTLTPTLKPYVLPEPNSSNRLWRLKPRSTRQEKTSRHPMLTSPQSATRLVGSTRHSIRFSSIGIILQNIPLMENTLTWSYTSFTVTMTVRVSWQWRGCSSRWTSQWMRTFWTSTTFSRTVQATLLPFHYSWKTT